MSAWIALLIAFQTAAIGPRAGAGANDIFSCRVGIQGQIIFPPYAAKIYSIAIAFEPVSAFEVPQEQTALPYLQFNFSVVTTPPGYYQIVINVPGMDLVRQDVVFGLADCNKTVLVQVPLRISPAIKPSPIEEDTVGIESLTRKTAGSIVSAFEKLLDHEPKAGPEDTASSLEGILKTNPDYYDANLELGLEYRKDNKNDHAIHSLTHAVEVNSGSMRARTALGQYSLEAGDNQKAADLLAQAVRLGSTSSEVYYMLGSAYYRLNRLDLAEASLTRALSLSPDLAKAHLQLYNVYMKKRQPGQALKEMEKYLEESPNADNRTQVQAIIDKLKKP